MSSSSRSSTAADFTSPSLAWLQAHPITFIPSLLPSLTDPSSSSSSRGGSDKSSVRDESAESYQRTQIRQSLNNDLALLLRLPLIEFYSHCIHNKSLQRCIPNVLSQISVQWKEVGGMTEMWKTKRGGGKQEDDDSKEDGDEDDDEDESSPPKNGGSSPRDLLRSISKRILAMYIRLCSSTTHASSTPSTSWLTHTFIATSLTSSPLFSTATLFDLIGFYSSTGSGVHEPLLQYIIDYLFEKLPYAFTTGMTQAFNLLVQVLHAQLKLIHAPYLTGSNNPAGANKNKPRLGRDEMKQLIENLTNLIWNLYAMCKLRPELLCLLSQGVGSTTEKKVVSSASSSTPATPPFLSLLTSLYTLTPLILLTEMGIKKAQVSASPELILLRKGCMNLLYQIMFKFILKQMGVSINKKNGKVTWSEKNVTIDEADLKKAKQSSAQATVSSVLSSTLPLAQACDLFYSSLLAINSTVSDSQKDSLCYLPASMKNLIFYNTSSTQNAFLKRFNEYFELDAILDFVYEQANTAKLDSEEANPGVMLTIPKIEKLLAMLQVIDAPLLKERIGWPRAKSSSKNRGGASSSNFNEEEEQKGSLPSSSTSFLRSNSTKSNGQPDFTLQISELHDIFSSFSTDYIAACLSEYNGSTEETTKAILEGKLPAYLESVVDKGKYRAMDHLDSSKLRRPDGVMSRQSSTGSGLLDQPVDDDDESIANLNSLAIDNGDDPDGFESFLKRTGRVSKEVYQQQQKKKHTGPQAIANQFDKEEALLLANKINQLYEDEYNDAFDDFESIVVDGSTPLELEERATKSLYDRDGPNNSEASDEPDGQVYNANNYKPGQARGMRGGRGGAASSARGGRAAGYVNYENVKVPATFMPSTEVIKDVHMQWRVDENRKEAYIAMLKAQKAYATAPSQRTPEMANDLDYALRLGLIKADGVQNTIQNASKNVPQQPQQQQPKQQQQQQQKQGKQQNQNNNQSNQNNHNSREQQRQARDNNHQNKQQQRNQSDDNDNWRDQSAASSSSSSSSSSSARGGFSLRGGRGGNAGNRGGNSDSSSSSSSSVAAPIPRFANTNFTNTNFANTNVSTNNNIANTNRSTANTNLSANAPSFEPNAATAASSTQASSSSAASLPLDAHTIEGDDDDDDEEEDNSRGSGRGGRGGRGRGGKLDPNDPRARRMKEKNKRSVANHNRKDAAMKKTGMNFG